MCVWGLASPPVSVSVRCCELRRCACAYENVFTLISVSIHRSSRLVAESLSLFVKVFADTSAGVTRISSSCAHLRVEVETGPDFSHPFEGISLLTPAPIEWVIFVVSGCSVRSSCRRLVAISCCLHTPPPLTCAPSKWQIPGPAGVEAGLAELRPRRQCGHVFVSEMAVQVWSRTPTHREWAKPSTPSSPPPSPQSGSLHLHHTRIFTARQAAQSFVRSEKFWKNGSATFSSRPFLSKNIYFELHSAEYTFDFFDWTEHRINLCNCNSFS